MDEALVYVTSLKRKVSSASETVSEPIDVAVISKGDGFVWIKRKVDPDVANRLKRLQFEGVGFCEESKRYFPSAGLAAQLLGFAGMDNHGLEGTELFFDKLLRVNDKEKKGADLAEFFSSEDFDQEFIPFAGPYDLQLTHLLLAEKS